MSEYRNLFNSAPEKYLATADSTGLPDLAICGTAYMADDETVYAMNGFMDRTITNLTVNPSCVFLARRETRESASKRRPSSTKQAPAWRYHCTFLGFTENESMENAIRSRTAIGAGRQVADSLLNLMVFRVENVRAVEMKKPGESPVIANEI